MSEAENKVLTVEEALDITLQQKFHLQDQFPRLQAMHIALSELCDGNVGALRKSEEEKQILAQNLKDLGAQLRSAETQITDLNSALVIAEKRYAQVIDANPALQSQVCDLQAKIKARDCEIERLKLLPIQTVRTRRNK